MGSNSVRSPSVIALANGIPVAGVLDVEISSNSYLSADRYRLRVSLTASGYAVWAPNQIEMDIQLGLDGASTRMILGLVDRVEVDPARGEVLVEGRDLTARFIEARTQENFENRTSSDIATTLALRQGLLPAVTPTTALVGRNFQNDHSRTTFDQHAKSTTEWDLLAKLAEQEGFDVWVTGEVLNFSPLALQDAPLLLTPENCISMRLERNLPLSSGLSVSVKSWDCRETQAIMQSSTTSGGAGAAANYVVVRPNMAAEAAQGLAQRIVSQMAQQARSITIDMPGDLTTQPRDTLVVADTGTDFDGIYILTAVERRVSFRHGFLQTIEARIPPWTDF